MSDNWVVQNLENSLTMWNNKLTEIWQLVTQSPQEFRNGAVWKVILNINSGVQAIGLALLVLFFVYGIIKTCTSFQEIKRPEQLAKLFIRFAIAKAIVTYGLDLMLAIFSIVQGIISTVISRAGLGSTSLNVLPSSIVSAIEECSFLENIPLWAVTILGGLVVTVLSFYMILLVYGRFFKLYMYTAIAPIPLSTIAGEPTQGIAKSFLKSFCGICLEGAIIIIACIIFSIFASTPPSVDTSASAINQVWTYLGELIFNMMILVGTIKISDHVVRDMFGF